MKKIILSIVLLLIVGVILIATVGVKMIDADMNAVSEHEPYQISEEAAALHQSLIVADWHADTALWARDMRQRHDYGHADLPRMQEGNLGLQVFTTVTKSPSGQNYERNETDASDNITTLALVQRWPMRTWDSLAERALYQAEKVKDLAAKRPEDFMVVRNQADLANWLEVRKTNSDFVAGIIGTEGSHALDGDLGNIQRLFDAGFRMMSLQHFFDNKLGGSLHGTSQTGLTEFGRAAIKAMDELEIIIDVSHSSEATARDVLALSNRPVVVSHTGFQGHCDTPRNISDELMQQIATNGGLIAVGFWAGAVCGTSAAKVVEAIQYGIELVGEDHIALGSDFDGTVVTSFDASEMAILTHEMLERGMPEAQIRKVMGGNSVRFLSAYLPQ
ncbi:MAG: dipeptidase [Pseudomonadota bacterium]